MALRAHEYHCRFLRTSEALALAICESLVRDVREAPSPLIPLGFGAHPVALKHQQEGLVLKCRTVVEIVYHCDLQTQYQQHLCARAQMINKTRPVKPDGVAALRSALAQVAAEERQGLVLQS